MKGGLFRNGGEIKRLFKDFFIVFWNNLFSLASGLTVSLGVPKILSLEDYGSYKVFMLYLSYIGLFHFGLIDGVAVKFAGRREADIGLAKYRAVTRLLYSVEIIVSLIVLSIVLLFVGSGYRFLGIMVALDITVHNAVSYYMYVMQISMRYKAYTLTGVYGNVFRIFGVFALLCLGHAGRADAGTYIVIYMAGELTQLAVCAWLCRSITFGSAEGSAGEQGAVRELFSVGMPLLISGLIVTFILNLDRQFISLLFSKKYYAVYSFSYSLMNLILTLISALSVVLYPMLKMKKEDALARDYDRFFFGLLVFIFGSFSFIPLMDVFVGWYLPNYRESLRILRVIFPIISPLAVMQIVVVNFFKVLEKTKTYLWISVFILIVSFALNVAGYAVFGSMEAIATASVLSCMLWLLVSNFVLENEIGIDGRHQMKYLIAMTVIYYLAYVGLWNAGETLAVATYIVLFMVMSWRFYAGCRKK